MKHARSQQLIPDDINGLPADIAQELAGVTFSDLREWRRLGGQCCSCSHQGWLNKYDLKRAFGDGLLATLQPLLHCSKCDSKGDNKFIVGLIARD